MTTSKTKTVLVGMSGGIDSTMAAYILKKQGLNVIGATMKIWDGCFDVGGETKSGCFGPGEEEDIKAAQVVAKKLGISHVVVDLKKEYRDNVLDNYIATYLGGETPNPCVRCNQKIKFGLLLEKARLSGIDFDYFATGHYAKVEYDEDKKRFLLKKSDDKKKDQSYFLHRLGQEQLSKIIFPLGSSTKEEIKKLAIEVGFPELAQKDESQDFFECKDNSPFFKDKDVRPGNIVDNNGKVLGTHNGIIGFTIGQRKGINISSDHGALYVTKIVAKRNEVVVGSKNELYASELIAKDLNWISIEKLEGPIRVEAKTRLHQEEVACTVFPDNDLSVKVVFDRPMISVTPGQSIVFYDSEVVVGGGVISKQG
jgi:tRNA-specific 2-thiouridylase